MKTKVVLILGLSTVLGVVAGYAYLRQSETPPAAAAPTSACASAPEGAPPLPAPAASPAVPRFFTNLVSADWRAVESEDYRRYIANLRGLGCPEPTIADIIIADVNKLFEGREKALLVPTNRFEYWKREQPGVNAERLQKARELAKEKRALLKDLLGVDVPEKAVTTVSQSAMRREQMVGFLPKEKQDQLVELEASFSVKAQTLMAGKARPTKDDLSALRNLESQLRASAAQIVTPQEKEELDLRVSRSANYLRMTMGDFDMTEPEFRQMVKLRQQFDDQFGYTSHEDPQKVAAQVELENQLRTTLGDERYTQFMHEQNWSTSSLRGIAEEQGIPKETAVKVFDLKQPALDAATKIRQDASLNPAQRQQALRAVQEETLRGIGQIIGPEAAQAYQRDGSWLRNLTREN